MKTISTSPRGPGTEPTTVNRLSASSDASVSWFELMGRSRNEPNARSLRRQLLMRWSPPKTMRIPQGPERVIAIPRAGIDLSWVGALALACLFCCVAPSRAADALDSWTKITVPDTVVKTPNDVIFVNGNYWAVGSTGRVQYSTDGKAWQVVQTPAQGWLNSIVYANGRFVAVGDHLTIISSSNGTNWTLHHDTASTNPQYTQVIYAGGKFVTVGGQGLVQYSTNGIDWTPVVMPNVNMFVSGVAYGNGTYVASGTTDGYFCIATSPDAVQWTKRYISVGWGYKAIGFFNGRFIAGNISELATSADGITWAKVPNLTFKYSNMSVRGIKVVNGRLFVYGNAGLLMSTTNGTDWQTHETSTILNITALGYNGDRLLIFRIGVISSGNGPAESAYWPPVVPVEPADPFEPVDATLSRVVNVSTRAWVGVEAAKLITGFVIQGNTPKKILVRGIGPALEKWGVQGVLADPEIKIFNKVGAEVAANNDWNTFADQTELIASTKAVYAFSLPNGSKDAALLVTLPPGLYSLHVSGVGNTTGVALAEVYDCDLGLPCKLINVSSRGTIGSGDSVTIPGFVVLGDGPKTLLVRGIGPTLGAFGVPGVIANPKLVLYNKQNEIVAQNDDWSVGAGKDAVKQAAAKAYAFALQDGSLDAAVVVTVPPGLYTAVVSGVDGATGVGLVEVYEISAD